MDGPAKIDVPLHEDFARKMPLRWTIDPETRSVITEAEGDITRDDLEQLAAAVDGAGVNGYRKLFDGSRAEFTMSDEDLLAVGVMYRQRHARCATGALAVVVSADAAGRIARLLGALAVADRPLRLFHEPEAARRWIATLPK